MRDLDVVLCGYYGFHNLGDDLLAESILMLLERCGIKKEKVGILSAAPAESEELLGITAVNRWRIGDVYRLLKRSRTLLLGGGGLFQDTTSIRSCLYYWGVVLLARFCGCTVWAVGQSVGPFRSSFSRLIAGSAFRLCRWIGVRDKRSQMMLKNWGIESLLSPDLVLAFDLPPLEDGEECILLNLRPWKRSFLEEVLNAAKTLSSDYKTKICCVAFSEEDLTLLKSLQAEGCLPDGDVVLIHTLEDFTRVARGASAALGMRLHFSVLCVLAGIPVIAAAYDPKVRSFAEEWNLSLLNEASTSYPLFSNNEKLLAEARDKITAIFSQGVLALMGKKETE